MKVESVYHAAVACLGPDASLTETNLVRALADHRDRLNRAPGEAEAERSRRFQA